MVRAREPSIKLHKEHGLNPTLSTCIICGKGTGEIVLLGAAYKGKAPMYMITSIEPCRKCREQYLSDGVLLVEAREENRIPTGRVVVIKNEAFTKVFEQPIPDKHIVYVEAGVLEMIGAV